MSATRPLPAPSRARNERRRSRTLCCGTSRRKWKASDRTLPPMTYCVGVLLNDGLVFASDSRTHAGVDNFSSFSKATVFERKDERVLVLLSSGNLAGTQAVINVLKQKGET